LEGVDFSGIEGTKRERTGVWGRREKGKGVSFSDVVIELKNEIRD
jgi:hypothetical protein